MARASEETDPLNDGEREIIRLLRRSDSDLRSPKSATPVKDLPPADKFVVTAKILRRILLGLPVIEGFEPGPFLPRAGFTFHNLLITDELDLRDARDADGGTLAPVAFQNCIFLEKIDLSGARLTSLALRDCHIVHLKGIGLHIEESLDLSGSRSGQDVRDLPQKYKPNEKTGAIVGNPRRELTELAQPVELEPNESNDAIRDLPETTGEARGLCWIELRNAYVGVDLDASGCTLVCPKERRRFRNCPHANYALDLRGSTIKGRLSLNTPQADRYKDKPEDKRCLEPFEAVGGVSIVRCFIGGSVCASGARLIAVEGNAFTAQRAEIKGHVFLDYSYEGWDNWTPFISHGFIDLNNVRILSSLQLSGAALLCDHLSRAGLVASGAEIGDKCWLCGIYAPKKALISSAADSPAAGENKKVFFPFFTDGGINLSRANIKGGLDLRGARLYPSSFGTALHAPGLTVHGEVKMTALEEGDPSKPVSCAEYIESLSGDESTAAVSCGSINFSSGRLHRGLELTGSRLKSWHRDDTVSYYSGLPCCFEQFVLSGYPSTRKLYRKPKQWASTRAALCADLATIPKINLERVNCTGRISMTDMTCLGSIEAKCLTLIDGTMDLWKARLGNLYLKDFWLEGEPHIGDLHLDTPKQPDESKRVRKPERGQGVDVLHFLNAHITGKLTITRRSDEPECPLTLDARTKLEVERYIRPYANLRELRVGALDDDSSLGWGSLCLKLEGFSCDRAPSRRVVNRPIEAYGPLRKNSGKSFWSAPSWILPYIMQFVLRRILVFRTYRIMTSIKKKKRGVATA